MEIQCECGKFRVKLKAFPQGTAGRMVCYCDDCQTYLHHLKRGDLLDANGGSEIIPAYPADVEIVSGREQLKCTRLSPKGMMRFSTVCCNTPIANSGFGMPWVGFLRRMYTVKDPNLLDQTLGPIRARVMGRFAKGTPPTGTAKKFNLKAFVSVVPFIVKGKLFGKSLPSPFFSPDGQPIVSPQILSLTERQAARVAAGV